MFLTLSMTFRVTRYTPYHQLALFMEVGEISSLYSKNVQGITESYTRIMTTWLSSIPAAKPNTSSKGLN